MLEISLDKFHLVMLFKNKISRLAKDPLLLLTGKVVCSKQVRQIQQFIQSPHILWNYRGPMKNNGVTCRDSYNWLCLQSNIGSCNDLGCPQILILSQIFECQSARVISHW